MGKEAVFITSACDRKFAAPLTAMLKSISHIQEIAILSLLLVALKLA
jgi:hypothetical protein